MRIDKEVRRMFWEAAKHYLADFLHKKSNLPPPPAPLTEKSLKEGKKTFFGITLSVHWPTISVFIICSRFVLGHLQEDILFAIDKFLIVNLGDCDIVNH